MSLSKHLLTAAAALAALSISTAAAADALVVRSTGPSAASYPVGRRLPPTDRVVLRQGDRVVLVGEGATRTLSGPGSFPVRAGNSAAVQTSGATLSRYLSTGGGTISRTGAVRGAGADGPPAPPNLWVLDFSKGGTFCVADAARLNLWRPDMAEDTLLRVENVSAPGMQASLAFVVGQNFRPWPGDTMPVADGQSYRISGPGLDRPTVIRFAMVSAATDPESVATALADKGCTTQLARLGDRLADSAPAP